MTRPVRSLCAYCPGFNPRDPVNRGASHGICPACLAKMTADLDARALAKAKRVP